MIKNFVFNDIVLYAKGWYERSEDIILDLGYLFSKIYAWEPKTEQEVAHMMLRVLDRVYLDLEVPRNCSGRWYDSHAAFEAEINNRMRTYEISRERAIIMLVIAILQGLSRSEIQLNAPHYGRKEHFRMGCLIGKNPISMTYAEMNRRAKKAFNYENK